MRMGGNVGGVRKRNNGPGKLARTLSRNGEVPEWVHRSGERKGRGVVISLAGWWRAYSAYRSKGRVQKNPAFKSLP
jgi:hypothetical protein